ncbi:MAG TPA: hypothetical protein VHM30_07920 [Gemmatimonadaceae bacterium]|nr:hypothetical protein [Gemmatimonadaceae bacterium]
MPTDPRANADLEARFRQLEERITRLQRAAYYLIWKRAGFGDQCIHCGSAYPKHEHRSGYGGSGGKPVSSSDQRETPRGADGK